MFREFSKLEEDQHLLETYLFSILQRQKDSLSKHSSLS
jgi:hypothetical protein